MPAVGLLLGRRRGRWQRYRLATACCACLSKLRWRERCLGLELVEAVLLGVRQDICRVKRRAEVSEFKIVELRVIFDQGNSSSSLSRRGFAPGGGSWGSSTAGHDNGCECDRNDSLGHGRTLAYGADPAVIDSASVRALRPLITVMLCATSAAVITACGGQDPDSATGGKAVIVAAFPTSGPSAATGKDMLEAARMELAAVGSRIGSYKLELKSAEGYADAHAASDPEGVTRAAAAAVADVHTVAWLGSFDSNETAVALPLLNSGGVSAVSATAAATPFTSSDPAFPGAPVKYFPESELYGRNFARTTANDARVALAALGVLSTHGVRRIYAADAGDTDGVAFSSSIERLAGRRRIEFVGHDSVAADEGNWDEVIAHAAEAGADAIAWGSVPQSGERELFSAIASSGHRLTVAIGPALAAVQVNGLPATGGPVWLFGGGVNIGAGRHTQTETEFARSFRKRVGHDPAPGCENAAFAVGLLVRAIRSAVQAYRPEPGGESLRSVVSRGLHEVRAVTVAGSTISISATGDRIEAPVGAWHRSGAEVVFDGIVR